VLRIAEYIVMTHSRESCGRSVTDVCQHAGIVLQLAEHNPVHSTYNSHNCAQCLNITFKKRGVRQTFCRTAQD